MLQFLNSSSNMKSKVKSVKIKFPSALLVSHPCQLIGVLSKDILGITTL